MATKISEYSPTPASNTDLDGINLSENVMVPSDVNDALRMQMAHLKDMDTGTSALTSPELTSATISGGTIDNTVIGGTTAAAGSFTNVTVSGTVDGRDVATDGTKLDAIEATADVTDATNVAGAGALMDSEVTNLAQVKAFDSSDYATAAQGTTADAALPKTGGAMTGAITTNSTFDGRDVAVDGSKLDGIEAGATADQTDAEIRAAVEAATDSNVFTDADHTKLNGIASSANNYVHPNHSGEVTSTADGATVIADNIVDEANLKVSNAPTNGYFLSAQSGAAGGLTWAAASGGGGGAWNLISTTTVTSNVSTVDFTSIGTYKRYVLKWDCTMNSAALIAIKIYDNGSLVTSSDYVGMRGAMASYSAVQTTSTRWLSSTGMTTQIGYLEISAVEPRLPFRMEVGGLSGTNDVGEITFSTGGLKSTYSLTSLSGLQLATTGTNDIATGRFALYGLSQ